MSRKLTELETKQYEIHQLRLLQIKQQEQIDALLMRLADEKRNAVDLIESLVNASKVLRVQMKESVEKIFEELKVAAGVSADAKVVQKEDGLYFEEAGK